MSEQNAEIGGPCDRYCETEWHKDGCAARRTPRPPRQNLDERFEHLRIAADEAENRLRNAVSDACGTHNPTQHRDGNAPWCPTCLRTWRGLEVGTR